MEPEPAPQFIRIYRLVTVVISAAIILLVSCGTVGVLIVAEVAALSN